jgi:hypothetical protein
MLADNTVYWHETKEGRIERVKLDTARRRGEFEKVGM